MAATPASINVNFISNYTGLHRVCWRIGNVGPYNCATTTNCLGGATPCMAVIGISVDNETCPQVIFNGYVQAECEDIASLNGRVPFSVTFTPDPVCDAYDLVCTCTTVDINNTLIINPGAGYNPLTEPTINASFVGCGVAPTGYGVTGDGGIKTLLLTVGGATYAPGNYTNIAGTTSGIGTGATFDVIVNGGGVITSVVINNSETGPGTDYVIADTIDFPALGGAGAVITVTSVNTGELQWLHFTTIGSCCVVPPIVTFDAPSGGGVTASAELTLDACASIINPTNCDATPSGIDIIGANIGEGLTLCSVAAPTIPAGWDAILQGCCYDCVSVQVAKDLLDPSTATLYYVDCVTRHLTEVVVAPGYDQTICMVNNSWLVVEGTPGGVTTVTVGAAC